MEDYLKSGDFVVVNKLKYGAKIPQTFDDVPWINTFFKDKFVNRTEDYQRLRGYSSPKVGDIVVFSHPLNEGVKLVKRCVGAPGTFIEVSNDKIKLNGRYLPETETVKHAYSFSNRKLSDLQKISSFLKIDTYIFQEDGLFKFNTSLTNRQMDSLVSKFKMENSTYEPTSSTPKIHFRIPKIGLRIDLTNENVRFYRSILTRYENDQFYVKNNKVFLGRKNVISYIFKNNYYFMMGENRPNSSDSRKWGLVPEKNIDGTVIPIRWF